MALRENALNSGEKKPPLKDKTMCVRCSLILLEDWPRGSLQSTLRLPIWPAAERKHPPPQS